MRSYIVIHTPIKLFSITSCWVTHLRVINEMRMFVLILQMNFLLTQAWRPLIEIGQVHTL